MLPCTRAPVTLFVTDAVHTWHTDEESQGSPDKEVAMTKTWTWSRHGWVLQTPDQHADAVVADECVPTVPSLSLPAAQCREMTLRTRKSSAVS
jgi:hypothetical protein